MRGIEKSINKKNESSALRFTSEHESILSLKLFPIRENDFLNGGVPMEMIPAIKNMSHAHTDMDPDMWASTVRKHVHNMYYDIWNCSKTMIGDKKVGFHDRLKNAYGWTMDDL